MKASEVIQSIQKGIETHGDIKLDLADHYGETLQNPEIEDGMRGYCTGEIVGFLYFSEKH